MATDHGSAIIKNLCYTAPRHAKSKLAATVNERYVPSSQNVERIEYMDKTAKTESHRSRRSKKTAEFQQVRQSLKDQMSVDEKEFYKNLRALKNEHKKTLKVLESAYYSKLHEIAEPGFQFEGSIEYSEDKSGRKRTHQQSHASTSHQEEFDPFETFKEEGKGVSYGPVVKDNVLDMSSKEMTGNNWKEKDSQDTEEIEDDQSQENDSGDEEQEESSSEEKENHEEELITRSPAMEMVENMWEGFSVDEYAPRNKSYLEEARQREKTHGKKKEWTPKITIPRPFEMTLREAQEKKKKSRSQKMLQEELTKKQLEDEAELKKKFRAQPVPATTFMPLYDAFIEKEQQRREYIREVSKAVLKSTEKPFNFVKREEHKKKLRRAKSLSNLDDLKNADVDTEYFKAKPFPKHLFDLTWADKLTEQEEYRKIRTRMRAEEMMAASSLPPNMQLRGREYTVGKLRQKRLKEREKKAFLTGEHKFRPNINHDVPDFDELHREFDKEMRKKKKLKDPTVVEPFNLRTTRLATAKRCSKSLSASQSMEDLRGHRRTLSGSRLSTSQDSLPFGVTESARLRKEAVHQSLDRQSAREKSQQKKVKERRKREKQLRPEISAKSMANDNTWQLKKASKEKIKSFREADLQRQEEYAKEIKEMQTRVKQRPYLFEQQTQFNATNKVEKRYAAILRDAGVSEELVNSLVTKNGDIIDAESEGESDAEDVQSGSHHLSSSTDLHQDTDEDIDNDEDISDDEI